MELTRQTRLWAEGYGMRVFKVKLNASLPRGDHNIRITKRVSHTPSSFLLKEKGTPSPPGKEKSQLLPIANAFLSRTFFY
jgi:hypothetical protein